uniref:LPXTG cell wall anchor domain-containing protein n=1 Tax=Streptomyces bobili TaxID=67280 RepID=UPI0011804BFD
AGGRSAANTPGGSAPGPGSAGGNSGDLASTGAGDLAAWTAATGITALAGGLLLLRRRGKTQQEQPRTGGGAHGK